MIRAYVYNGKLVCLTRNQRVGIFPPKSKSLFYLSLAFFVSLIGNQRVGIFPPKSWILFSSKISFIWYQKFQDWPPPLWGVRLPKYAECWPVRRKEEKERERHARRELAHADSLEQNYVNNKRRWTVSSATIVEWKRDRRLTAKQLLFLRFN